MPSVCGRIGLVAKRFAGVAHACYASCDAFLFALTLDVDTLLSRLAGARWQRVKSCGVLSVRSAWRLRAEQEADKCIRGHLPCVCFHCARRAVGGGRLCLGGCVSFKHFIVGVPFACKGWTCGTRRGGRRSRRVSEGLSMTGQVGCTWGCTVRGGWLFGRKCSVVRSNDVRGGGRRRAAETECGPRRNTGDAVS